MPYRSFAAVPAGPVGTEQTTSATIAPKQCVQPQLAFPLLMAALPEINQSAVLKVPVVENTSPDNVRIPVQEPAKPMATNAAVNSIRPKPKAASQLFWPRHGLEKPIFNQHLTASSAESRTATNLAAVFQKLQTASSSREEAAEAKSDLQEMFSRL